MIEYNKSCSQNTIFGNESIYSGELKFKKPTNDLSWGFNKIEEFTSDILTFESERKNGCFNCVIFINGSKKYQFNFGEERCREDNNKLLYCMIDLIDLFEIQIRGKYVYKIYLENQTQPRSENLNHQ